MTSLFPETRRSLTIEITARIPTTTHQSKQIITFRPKGRAPISSIANTPNLNEAIAQWDRILAPHAPGSPLKGAIRLSCVFTFPWRETEPGKNRVPEGILHTSRPDLSNLIKTMEDRLQELGYVEDDARIAQYGEVTKLWGDHPGLRLTLEEIG